MDNRNHHLEAPEKPDLDVIEQLPDRSELSTIYPQQQTEWQGTIMGESERTTERDKATANITLSIRKSFLVIGLLAPLPFVFAGLVIALTLQTKLLNDPDPKSQAAIAVIAMLTGGLWLTISGLIFRRLGNIFYNHALRATPFLMTLLCLLGISIQIFFIVTLPIHHAQPLLTVGIVSVLTVLWSLVLSYLLLWTWTTPRLSDNLRISLIAATAVAAIITASAVSLMTFLAK